MCVIGSVNMAVAGRTATEILNKYFPGLDIGVPGGAIAPSVVAARGATPPAARPTPTAAAPVLTGVSLALPDEDEGERDAIAQLTDRTRGEIARALGLPTPARVVVRFHPTTASYERATSQPWFTSGAVVGGELHLLPLAVLRDRGVLERMIRHELVHLMADPLLGQRPAWVREGAAIYFAGRRPIPGEPERPSSRPPTRPSCPADPELVRPVSAGALSNAFARALACFSRQVESGRSWRDVR